MTLRPSIWLLVEPGRFLCLLEDANDARVTVREAWVRMPQDASVTALRFDGAPSIYALEFDRGHGWDRPHVEAVLRQQGYEVKPWQ